MTIAKFRRRWPSLIRQSEKDMRKKFKKKPTLKLLKRTPHGDAYNEMFYHGEKNHADVIVRARVCLGRRMVRDHERLAEVVAMHELLENLAHQNGYSLTKAHQLANRHEKKLIKRADLPKSTGWVLRDYYGDKRRQKERGMLF